MGNGCLGRGASKVAPVKEPCKSTRGADAAERAGSRHDCKDADQDQKASAKGISLPHFFEEILQDLERHQSSLGGLLYFSGTPYVEGKVKKKQLAASYSDYEYVYLTVLGLAQLHINLEAIIAKNNGDIFTRNPGVQMLERVTGFTMHANREGANHILRTAPACLIDCFQASKKDPRGSLNFFKTGFDRTGDPCLEGRTKLMMEYLELVQPVSDASAAGMPPWEDVSLQALPKGCVPQDVVAEHLRVFIAECTWRWSQQTGKSYAEAKEARLTDAFIEDFSNVFNAYTFQAAVLARGVVAEEGERQWESKAKDMEEWFPYDPEVSAKIDRAYRQGLPEVTVRLGPRSWQYVIDLRSMVQRNQVTGQERKLRSVEGTPSGKLTEADLAAGIEYFVEMCTLPPAPEALREEAPAGAATASDPAALSAPAVSEVMGVVPEAAVESPVAAKVEVEAPKDGELPAEAAVEAVVPALPPEESKLEAPSAVDAEIATRPAAPAASTEEQTLTPTEAASPATETPAMAIVAESASPAVCEAALATVPEPASMAKEPSGASTAH